MDFISTSLEFAETVAKRLDLVLSDPELLILAAHFKGFAESHVHNALEKAAKEAYANEGRIGFSWEVDEESILNAYPDELIK